MNIAFFLLPKKEVVYLKLKSTMRQALEKMDHHGYTAVPIIDEHGKYVGTLSEGDLLRMMKENPSLSFVDTEKLFLKDIPRRSNDKAVRIDAEIEDLLSLAVVQNFIPVVDDNGIFIGIIRRSVIIEYYANMQKPQQKIKG